MRPAERVLQSEVRRLEYYAILWLIKSDRWQSLCIPMRARLYFLLRVNVRAKYAEGFKAPPCSFFIRLEIRTRSRN